MARDNFYSNAVVWVKVTLPLIALALLSSLFLLSGSPDPDAALPYAEVDIDQITREQRVTEPRFAGVLGDDQALVLVAEAVSAASGQTEQIRAQGVEGRLDLNQQDYVSVIAALGNIDMARQVATLSDGVTLESSLGYRMNSDRLLVALNRVDLSAPTPVIVTGPGLEITADSMELSGDQGEAIVRFNGSVRMLYDPQG
ncbi:LPS export ABC transporter periplasmic protein LptC [Hasllibacter sp. MH4015]|uniref:LPS export ABC transporter periplasmic protein LptC n=1 Tax=Hasllibacter sp. MH4015 TaxID=2854029 RepID=UPI001CD4402E|nr:LPS export ABC transporter periplasmic protein LptC [Hasllibacter sp. MH4015]